MQDLAQKLLRDILQLCNCCILVDLLFPRQVLAKPWPIFCLCCNATFSRQIRPIQAWSWLSGIPSGTNMAEKRLRNILVRTHETLSKWMGRHYFPFRRLSETFWWRSSDSSILIDFEDPQIWIFLQVVAPTSDLVQQIAEVARVASARSQRGFQVSGPLRAAPLVNRGNRKKSTSSGGFFLWNPGRISIAWYYQPFNRVVLLFR